MNTIHESRYPTPIPRGPVHETRQRRAWPWIVLGLVAGLVLTLGGTALAHGFGGGRHHGHGDVTEADIEDHVDFVVGYVLSEVDATDDQHEAIDAIVDRVVPQLVELHAEGRALHESFRDAIAGEPVDPAAVESLRLELVDLVDRASQVGLGALVEAGQVLTTEQRDAIRDRLDRGRD